MSVDNTWHSPGSNRAVEIGAGIRFGLGLVWATAACLVLAPGAFAQDHDEIARQLSNPAAATASLPFVFDWDTGAGSDGDGQIFTLKMQPVVPFALNDEFNVISRTIVPLTFQTGTFADDVFSLGDTTQSFFITPSRPGDLIWGIGPAFLVPTATDGRVGTGKFGVGPTALLLSQQGKLGIGILATHFWSVAGDPSRGDVSLTQLQPFVNLSLGDGQMVSANLESSYDWTADQWTVPLNVDYSKVFSLNDQTMKWQVGGRVYLTGPENGPDLGLRTGLTFVLP